MKIFLLTIFIFNTFPISAHHLQEVQAFLGGIENIAHWKGDRIINGNSYFIGPGSDLSGADLSGADLSGAYLDRADLNEANLSGTNLTNTSLLGSNLSETNLNDANLSWAYLRMANLKYAEAYGTNVSGAYLITPHFKGFKSKDLNYTSASLTNTTTGEITNAEPILPIEFKLINGHIVGPGVNLVGANFNGLWENDLEGIDFTGVTSGGIEVPKIQVIIDLGDLSNAYTPTYRLVDSSNPNGAFPPDSSYSIYGGYIVGPGVDLTGADLRDVHFDVRTLGSFWTSIEDPRANLSGAILKNANLSGSNLNRVNCTNADFSGADLSNSFLHYVDFNGANLIGANLTGAKGTQNTQFDGAIFVNYNVNPSLLQPNLKWHNDHVKIDWQSFRNVNYIIETSNDLVNWTAITNEMPGDNTNFSHNLDVNHTHFYYRIVSQQ